jgi:hypothetical protein
MKSRYFLIAATLIIGVAGLLFIRKKPEIPTPPTATTTARAGGMKLSVATDPALVFKKAFWRHPSAEDQILHAERREWSADDGVRKWQWFIAVNPGPRLLEWLASNPFSLANTDAPVALVNPPTWFPRPSPDFEIQKNAEGHFILMLSADRKHLYATDSGLGFTPADTPP